MFMSAIGKTNNNGDQLNGSVDFYYYSRAKITHTRSLSKANQTKLN